MGGFGISACWVLEWASSGCAELSVPGSSKKFGRNVGKSHASGEWLIFQGLSNPSGLGVHEIKAGQSQLCVLKSSPVSKLQFIA